MTEPNPYQSPLLSAKEREEQVIAATLSRGWPGPIPLAIVGLLLAGGAIALLTLSILAESGPVLAMVLAVPVLRLVWIVVAIGQKSRYSQGWLSGERTFLSVTLVINCVLLGIDVFAILLFGVCLAVITSSNLGN